MRAERRPVVVDGALAAPLERVGVVGHLGRPLDDVLAGVAALGQRLAPLAGDQRGREQLHLRAAVVEVVLALDRPAGPLAAAGRRASP